MAAVAEANNAVLIAFDADFKSIAQRGGVGQRRFRKLSLLRFEGCRGSKSADRLKAAMSLIRHEWTCGSDGRDRRMFVVITATSIRTHR